MSHPTPKPFQISVPEDTLQWIKDRVNTSRLPVALEQPAGKEYDYGIPRSTIDPIVEYWKSTYDWRKVEAELNQRFRMFTADINSSGEDITIHFVHHRSEREDAIPLLFCHGWPGSFLEVGPIIDLLTNPSDPSQQAFHVVAPSIPGFAFSSPPKRPGFHFVKIGTLYHQLMHDVLGYKTYVGQGGDWGSVILRGLAKEHPDACAGIHLNMMVASPPSPFKNPIKLGYLVLGWMTEEEKKRLGRFKWWMTDENGYAQIMGTKPLAISFALTDSPVGQLAWIRDKLEVTVDEGHTWDPEEVITWTMFYILAGNVATCSIYREAHLHLKSELLDAPPIAREVAVGFSSFPKEVGYVPKWWAEGSVAENISFWKVNDKGGHFASLEVPEVLVRDVREFMETVDKKRFEELKVAGKASA